MMSPGGKIEWICPRCYSSNIQEEEPRHNFPWCHEGWCKDCGALFCWRARIKLTKKQRLHRLITGDLPHEHDGKQTTP